MNEFLSTIWPALTPETAEILFKLALAALFGLLIGIERTTANKTAGMRTYALISMGSCLFVVISQAVASRFIGISNFDPLRVASQIVVGIGFVGGGLIMVQGHRISGITTAAGIWVAAGMGVAVGFHFYTVAAFVTLLTIFIFTILWHVEGRIKAHSKKLFTHRDPLDDI